MRRYIALLSVVCLTAIASEARAIDPFNGFQPAFYYDDGLNEFIFVRKADGSIWHSPFPQQIWVSNGTPSTGATSGPAIARIQLGGVWKALVFVEVNGTIFVNTTSAGVGTTWSSGLVPAPPGGLTSALAASYNIDNADIHLAVRGGSNLPFIGTITASGSTPVFSGWTQIGTTPIISAPSVAETDWRVDVFALNSNPSNNVMMTTCQYPSCFGSWTAVPGNGFGHNSLGAYWTKNFSNDGPFLFLAELGDDGNAWLMKYDNNTNIWTGWSFAGGPIASPVGVTNDFGAIGLPNLAAKINSTDYGYSPGGGSWYSIGHP